jgi:hypothetical protein
MSNTRNRLLAKLAKEIDADANLTAGALAAGVGGGTDSAAVIALIDSDYVIDRAAGAIITYNTILSGDD